MAKKAVLPKTIYILFEEDGTLGVSYYESLDELRDDFDSGKMRIATFILKETGVMNLEPRYTPDK